MSDIVNIKRRASFLDASPQFDSYSKVIIHVSDESTVTVGDDTGRTLEIDNPFGTQQMAADILARLRGTLTTRKAIGLLVSSLPSG